MLSVRKGCSVANFLMILILNPPVRRLSHALERCLTSNPFTTVLCQSPQQCPKDHRFIQHNHSILESKQKMSTFVYPEVRREDLVEKIFDTNVPDPYRYFEDSEAAETKDFISKQNSLTEPYLTRCPHRQKFREILEADQNYEKIGCPFKRGKKYYLFKNTGLQPQSILYQQASLDSEPVVFFDPNELSSDGTVSLSISSFSPDGEYFAYGLSYSGSDWTEIRIKNATTSELFKEKLVRAKFTNIGWTHDNRGFFYAQFPSHKGDAVGTATDSHENHSIYYHLLGTDQTRDILKVNFPNNPKWIVGFEVSHDGKYMHVFPSKGCTDQNWYYCRLEDFDVKDKLTLKTIYDQMANEFQYITNNGDTIYFRTNQDAKNYKIVKMDLNNPAKENWVDVVPNHPENVLQWAEAYSVGGQDFLLINFMRKVANHLELRELNGKSVREFNIPLGSISKTSGRRQDEEFFFQFTSFLTPGRTFHFDLKELNCEPKLLRQSQPKNFNPDDYNIEQVFYKSKDKTEVPMFIVHKKTLVKDGSNPCILYGYGGFNIQLTPAFSAIRLTWLKNFSGVFAVANIRGGGEFGHDWHEGGSKLNKQNVFDDFIAAGEYLIESKYTNREKLAIQGGSNGGLLVAATSNQRPDLFGATICQVGVLDMIRYSSFTIGGAWITDYGDPKEEEHFKNLIKYSPYHNIPDFVDRYPATLLLTADHDDRVVPAHSLKFIAQLQYKLGKQLPETPLLIRVDTNAGHGAGKPVAKVIDDYIDIYSFLYNTLKLGNAFKDS